MDLITSLRECKKKAEIGDNEGNLITYMSSLGLKDIFS